LATAPFLFEKLKESFAEQLPFVAYKIANQNTVKAVFQKDAQLHLVKDYTEEGFVFAPFDSEQAPVFFPRHTAMEVPFAEEDLEKVAFEKSKVFPESTSHQQEHLELVNKTKEFLDNAAVSKVVIARSKTISFPDFNFLKVFQRLLLHYPNATSYVWYHPKVGLWMGASPELLLEVKETNFHTMSLAGTQTFEVGAEVTWGAKELEEQKLVTDYVVANLKKSVTSCSVSETHTVRAGALLHLKTAISGTLDADKGLSEIIATLHPTPAVCGYPREKAKAFILKNEKFDRSYYTGFFGELNVDSQTALYVNLRCLERDTSKTLKLYIGGGITAKSNAEHEWEETVSKCKTMEAVL